MPASCDDAWLGMGPRDRTLLDPLATLLVGSLEGPELGVFGECAGFFHEVEREGLQGTLDRGVWVSGRVSLPDRETADRTCLRHKKFTFSLALKE